MRNLILTCIPILSSLLLVTAVPSVTLLQHVDPREAAPLLSAENAREVPDHYIVVFKKDVNEEAIAEHFAQVEALQLTNSDTKVRHVFKTVLKGYAGKFDGETVDQLRFSPIVEYVEKDQYVHASKVQKDAPWGLARLSTHSKLGSEHNYVYDENAGKGINAYVIDTGIYVNHTDFEGRARWGITIPENEPDDDTNGHGTHVSGTIAGKTYGVAKQANLIAVKVLDSNGSGTLGDVIAGIEWAVEDHLKAIKERAARASVSNMSLGGGYSRAFNEAVNAAVEGGLHMAVAAGNEDDKACDTSPGSAENVITVGASSIADERAWFSNWGKCVDVFAPGLSILSSWTGSPDATNTISGTSMASPHVAGYLAYYLSIQDDKEPLPSPEAAKQYILTHATEDALKKVGRRSPNKLLYSNPPANAVQDGEMSEEFMEELLEEMVVLELLEEMTTNYGQVAY